MSSEDCQKARRYPSPCEHVMGTRWSEHHLRCNSSSCYPGKHTNWRQWWQPGWRRSHIRAERTQAWLHHPGGQAGCCQGEGAEEWLHFHFCLVFRLLVEGQVGPKKNNTWFKLFFSINQCIFFSAAWLHYICLSFPLQLSRGIWFFSEFGLRDKLKFSLFIIKAGVIIWTFWRNHIVFWESVKRQERWWEVIRCYFL